MGRLFLPWIHTDLLARILLASIRNLGACPCPRCLVPLSRAHNLGMARDMSQRVTMARVDDASRRGRVYAARRLIYEKKYRINGAAIEDLLKDQSLVPTSVCVSIAYLRIGQFTQTSQNAFSDRLAPLGVNFFSIFVPDLMHDFELGEWRSLFIHLLRILDAADKNLLVELDRR